MEIDTSWFILITLLYVIWFWKINKNGDIKSLFFINYAFNFCVFYGPLLYYKIGYDYYSIVLSTYSIYVFYIINIAVVCLNLIFYHYVKRYRKHFLYSTFRRIKFENIRNTYVISVIYVVTLLFCLGYSILYGSHFPLVKLITTGDLGVRLDANIVIPHYVTFSCICLVFVPSAFLYFKYSLKDWRVNLVLFMFTLFCLTAGGNKGIVSFFLIFYLLFNIKGKIFKMGNIFKFTGLALFLAVIYAVMKGRTELNQDTISYLLESPLRRLFAAQGAGYIGRIKMMHFDLFANIGSIKEQVYAYIYRTRIGGGTSPTHFTGNLIVQIGYALTFFCYIFYLNLLYKLMNTATDLFRSKENSFILWNFFIIIYISTNAGITVSNGIRVALVIFNIFLIANAIRIKKT